MSDTNVEKTVCPNCKSEIFDGNDLCPQCGLKIKEEFDNELASEISWGDNKADLIPLPPKKHKALLPFVIGIVVVALVIVSTVVALFFGNRNINDFLGVEIGGIFDICYHEDTEWIIDYEPTLYAEGKKHLECNSCGKTIDTKVIEELYLTQAEVVEKLKASVVKVICYDYDSKTEISQGSGFFIDSKGTFITNAHVVEDCFFIKIKTSSGMEYDVDVMYKFNYTSSDYAICKAKYCYTSVAVEFTEGGSVGDTVYALGYPNDAFTLKTTKGTITSNNVVEGSKHYFSNTAWIDHGSSGGILSDDKGRVIGITTGIFSSGEYAALKYQDFKTAVEGTFISGKEPWEYFHKAKEVLIASYNVDDYFDIIVNGNAMSDTRVSYYVTVKLNDKYRKSKILLDSVSIRISIKINTEYSYTEVTSYGSYRRTKTDSTYQYFTFWNENDLKLGDTAYASSSVYIPYSTDYYGMTISYEVDIFSGSGTIIIFD